MDWLTGIQNALNYIKKMTQASSAKLKNHMVLLSYI